MKNIFLKIVISTLIFSSCDSNTSTTDNKVVQKKNNEVSTQAISQTKLMLVGSWELIGGDSLGVKFNLDQLAKIPFYRLDFTADTTFRFYPEPSKVDSGTFELMEKSREIVFTSKGGSDRMLIKELTPEKLITKRWDFKLYFRKIK